MQVVPGEARHSPCEPKTCSSTSDLDRMERKLLQIVRHKCRLQASPRDQEMLAYGEVGDRRQ